MPAGPGRKIGLSPSRGKNNRRAFPASANSRTVAASSTIRNRSTVKLSSCAFFIWGITPDTAQSEQAFSDDGGKTWETNWVNKYTRLAPQLTAQVDARGRTGVASKPDPVFLPPIISQTLSTVFSISPEGGPEPLD